MRRSFAVLMLCAGCGVASPEAQPAPALSEPVPGIVDATEDPQSLEATTGYNACHSRHYRECEGPRPVCFFSPASQEDRWSVCSQRCEEDSDCHDAPPGGTASVRCKDIITHPPPPGACVLDCEHGETCPEGMVCATWLGICAHAESLNSAM